MKTLSDNESLKFLRIDNQYKFARTREQRMRRLGDVESRSSY